MDLPPIDGKARGSTDADFTFNYLNAKAADKAHQADLREIELNEIRARLIPAEPARAVVGEAFAVVRERLLSIRVEGLSAESARLLAQILIDAVEPLSDRKAETIGAPQLQREFGIHHAWNSSGKAHQPICADGDGKVQIYLRES